jgi:hypothetical protein
MDSQRPDRLVDGSRPGIVFLHNTHHHTSARARQPRLGAAARAGEKKQQQHPVCSPLSNDSSRLGSRASRQQLQLPLLLLKPLTPPSARMPTGRWDLRGSWLDRLDRPLFRKCVVVSTSGCFLLLLLLLLLARRPGRPPANSCCFKLGQKEHTLTLTPPTAVPLPPQVRFPQR